MQFGCQYVIGILLECKIFTDKIGGMASFIERGKSMESNNTRPKEAKISFTPAGKEDFYSQLKSRVEQYFKESGKPKHGNLSLWVKTAVIFSIYGFAYAMIMSNWYQGWALIGWYTLLGFGMGLIGFNFCHDVIHGAFFPSSKLNRIFSYVFDFNGESSYIWRVSHNLLHHTYTNIPGHDEDIDKAIIMRFSPTDKHYFFHKFQHIYALPLYAFTSFNWVLFSDYKWFIKEMKKGSIPSREIVLFFLFKFLNLFVFLILPLIVLSAPYWQVMLGFLFMHFAGGTTISLVFQMAHLVEGVEFPQANEEGKIERCWAEHELRTTSDFATQSKFWAYWLGGLNYQVEHHLFTYISHVHYPALQPILKKTAEEYGIPYHEQKTMKDAVLSHLRTLKRLGNPT